MEEAQLSSVRLCIVSLDVCLWTGTALNLLCDFVDLFCIVSILCDSKTIEELFAENQEKITAIQKCYAVDYRCGGCNERCSGGNRIVAAATSLEEMKKDYNIETIYQAFSEKDPACPIYEVVK